MKINIGFLGVIVVGIILLKLAGIGAVAGWSWWVVITSIIWVPVVTLLSICTIVAVVYAVFIYSVVIIETVKELRK